MSKRKFVADNGPTVNLDGSVGPDASLLYVQNIISSNKRIKTGRNVPLPIGIPGPFGPLGQLEPPSVAAVAASAGLTKEEALKALENLLPQLSPHQPPAAAAVAAALLPPLSPPTAAEIAAFKTASAAAAAGAIEKEENVALLPPLSPPTAAQIAAFNASTAAGAGAGVLPYLSPTIAAPLATPLTSLVVVSSGQSNSPYNIRTEGGIDSISGQELARLVIKPEHMLMLTSPYFDTYYAYHWPSYTGTSILESEKMERNNCNI